MVNDYDIAFDLDDVIFETALPLLIQCQKNNWISKEFNFEDIVLPTFYQLFGWKRGTHELTLLTEEFFVSLKHNKNVVEFIWYIMDRGVEVCYITSRPISVARKTFEVLDNLGLQWQDVYFAMTDDKASFAKQMGVRVIVDDRPQVALGAGRVGICACVPSMPYNSQVLKCSGTMEVYRGEWDYLKKIIIKKLEIDNER